MAQGIEVKDRGRVPAEVAVKFNGATGLVVRAMSAHPHAKLSALPTCILMRISAYSLSY